MLTNSIGPFTFIELHSTDDRAAPPLLVAEQGRIVQRAGVDGTGVIREGIKGEPFQMRSRVDAANLAAADALAQSYRTIQLAGTYSLVWCSIDYDSTYQHVYVVLKVTPRVIKPLANSSGGLNSPSLAWVEAIWQLLPIKV